MRSALFAISGEVPLFELKAQPRQLQKTSMNDFIQTHDKQKVYTQALEEAEKAITKVTEPINSATSSESEDDDSSEEAAKRANKFGVKTGISQATVQAI